MKPVTGARDEIDDVDVAVQLDGRASTFTCEPRTSLADALRDHCASTAVRLGCEEGVCGSCTVLLDGLPQRSCLVLAVQADGAEVQTAAGLDETIDDLRAALRRHFAFQCGFCASGILVTAAHWLETDPDPSRETVVEALAGSICRCTGYDGMITAVLEVANDRRNSDGPAAP